MGQEEALNKTELDNSIVRKSAHYLARVRKCLHEPIYLTQVSHVIHGKGDEDGGISRCNAMLTNPENGMSVRPQGDHFPPVT